MQNELVFEKETTGNIQVFSFNGNDIREITDEEGNPWFVATDICRYLQLTNPSVVVGALDDDERSKLNLGRQGLATIINESGLYSLILRSRKPEAKAFKKWVTSEVLPSIRKTGQYNAIKLPDFSNPAAAARAWADEYEAKKTAQSRLLAMAPKVELADMAIRDEKEHYSITQAGKHLGLRQSEIFAIMRREKLIDHENLPTQKAIDLEILQLRTNPSINGRNRPQAIMTMKNIYNFKNRYLSEVA